MMYFFTGTILLIALSGGLGIPQRVVEVSDQLKLESQDRETKEVYTELAELQTEESRTEELPTEKQDTSQQQFFPSFSFNSQPLGHSRPFFYHRQPETAYSQRPYLGYGQQITYDTPRFSGYKDDYGYFNSDNILGSGNFGVIRGGTFYEGAASTDYDSYYNGHGAPFYYLSQGSNPKAYHHDHLDNFKDFDEINTANSQTDVVYVKKNDTKQEPVPKYKPNNIIEKLKLIDLESLPPNEVPQKKQSYSKLKLAKTFLEKKHKKKFNEKVLELNEPLLALS